MARYYRSNINWRNAFTWRGQNNDAVEEIPDSAIWVEETPDSASWMQEIPRT